MENFIFWLINDKQPKLLTKASIHSLFLCLLIFKHAMLAGIYSTLVLIFYLYINKILFIYFKRKYYFLLKNKEINLFLEEYLTIIINYSIITRTKKQNYIKLNYFSNFLKFNPITEFKEKLCLVLYTPQEKSRLLAKALIITFLNIKFKERGGNIEQKNNN